MATVLYLAGKFHDAPLFPVDRKRTKPLERSGLVVTGWPRRKTWQERYALPRVSQATEVSPPACQYWRANEPKKSPRVKPLGTVLSAQERPPSRLNEVPQVPSPRR